VWGYGKASFQGPYHDPKSQKKKKKKKKRSFSAMEDCSDIFSKKMIDWHFNMDKGNAKMISDDESRPTWLQLPPK
jgi:hypothetical protein